MSSFPPYSRKEQSEVRQLEKIKDLIKSCIYVSWIKCMQLKQTKNKMCGPGKRHELS